MTTLIEVEARDGTIQRCDARCYGASPDEQCNCICGGNNHGVGFVDAHNNTFEHAQAWIVQAEKRSGSKFVRVGIFAKGIQKGLFA